MKLHFELITPERIVVSKYVDSVSVQTEDGQMTVLPGHIPLVSLITVGEIVLRDAGKLEHIATSQGFVQVLGGNRVNAFVDTAEKAEEIKVDLAEEARARAQEAMKTQKDKLAFFKAKLEHEKSLARLHVAKRHRRHSVTATDTDNPNI